MRLSQNAEVLDENFYLGAESSRSWKSLLQSASFKIVLLQYFCPTDHYCVHGQFIFWTEVGLRSEVVGKTSESCVSQSDAKGKSEIISGNRIAWSLDRVLITLPYFFE